MKKKLIYCIIFMIFSSCYSKDNIPSDIIKPEEMKSIMWDVMRSQTLATQMSLKDSTINVAIQTKELTKKTFEIHKIDSAQFSKSYNWYVRHPLRFKVIFDSLDAQKQKQNILQYNKPIFKHK
ncbi:MAG TPA: DUF4296 domain-containing protein [Hanamia sp.]